MGRRIVVLADGTGNSAAKPFKTNVWRLYEALALEGGDQIATFSDGVGTSSFKPFAIFGLALGFGVKRRVLALYKFLCINYQPGDEIYVFGFSRGAFIARVLVGMIFSEGLVDFRTKEELDINALAAYRNHRREAFETKPWQFWVHGSRFVRDRYVDLVRWLTRTRSYAEFSPRQKNGDPRSGAKVPIRFLGVWDTVAAYGLPIDELTRAVDRFVWPMTFASNDLIDSVQCARQAFSLDDERRTFFPIPFNETPALTDGDHPRLRQVWFAGSHSNVGGGYPDDRLSYLPLCWMIAEAAKCGLDFKRETVANYWDYGSENGRIYDSRSGVGLFYRYHPRAAAEIMNKQSVNALAPHPEARSVVPLVDYSAMLRIAKGGDRYAPVSLPANLAVLTPLGKIEPFALAQDVQAAAKLAKKQETPDYLPLPKNRPRKLQQLEKASADALNLLRDRPYDAEQVNLLMAKVWWRRVVYFLMLGVTLVAAFYPVFGGYYTDREIDGTVSGLVGPFVGVLESFIPGFLKPWTDAIRNWPSGALILAAALLGLVWLSGRLRVRIRDHARGVWNVEAAFRDDEMVKARAGGSRRAALAGAVLFALVAAVSYEMGVETGARVMAVMAAACVAAFLIKNGDDRPFLLRLANRLRLSPLGTRAYHAATQTWLPALFLLGAVYLSAAVINKGLFQVFAAAGQVCAYSPGDNPNMPQQLLAKGPFPLDRHCWDSGVRLDAGVTYRIKMFIADPKDFWFDDVQRSDTRGFSAGDTSGIDKLFYYGGNLFKRWWGQPWFKPIARIGQYGNEEYPLEQLQPVRDQANTASALFAVIKPRQPGELYLYVNDAGIGIPGLFDRYYGNNQGRATVEVWRVDNEVFDR